MKNLKIETLGANQNIVTVDNKQVTFISYDSTIADYDIQNRILYLHGDMWDYSNTTRKYFKKFINYFTQFTYIDKKQFLKELECDNPKIIIK